jgi:hypothetical protein
VGPGLPGEAVQLAQFVLFLLGHELHLLLR